MLDKIILNGQYPDFEHNIMIKKPLGIKDGRLVLLEKEEEAKEIIDAKGAVVAPGFIDIHMHEERLGDEEDIFDVSYHMLRMGVTTTVGGNCGSNRQDIKDFFERVDREGSPTNYMLLTGHNHFRDKLGINRYEKATDEEILKMRELIRKDLYEEGACGLSFGLAYARGIDMREILGITEGLEDVLLTFHARQDAKGSRDSVIELIEVAKRTGLPVQMSHMGSNAAMGYMEEALELLREARAEGVDIEADCYPYAAFSTDIGTSVFDEGCFENWGKSYEDILLIQDPYRNVRCDEELFKRVREEYPDMAVVAFVMNEEEVSMALAEDFVFVASDGGIEKGQGHPRSAGTFPRVLGKYVREEQVLTLIEALKKMSLMPAKRLGLSTKGAIKEGFDADLVIFDPETVSDRATFTEPTLAPLGIMEVFIAGERALKDQEILHARLGRSIRKVY